MTLIWYNFCLDFSFQLHSQTVLGKKVTKLYFVLLITYMMKIQLSVFSNSFEGGNWVTLIYGGGKWSMWTKVNATKREDTGKVNSSPVTSTAPIVRVQQNCKRVINIGGKLIFILKLFSTGDKTSFLFCY